MHERKGCGVSELRRPWRVRWGRGKGWPEERQTWESLVALGAQLWFLTFWFWFLIASLVIFSHWTPWSKPLFIWADFDSDFIRLYHPLPLLMADIYRHWVTPLSVKVFNFWITVLLSNTKNNNFLIIPVLTMKMTLENIMLSEKSQSQRTAYYKIPVI